MDLEKTVSKLIDFADINKIDFDYIFISLGKPNLKAQVKLFKDNKNLSRNIIKFCQKFKKIRSISKMD